MNYRLTTDKTWKETERDLADTMRKWGIAKWRVENPLPPRARTNTRQNPAERIVTLTYTKQGVEIVLQMNQQTRAVDNLRALYLAVEDMRMIEARGIDDLVRQAYAQLPAPKQATTGAYTVLDIPATSTMDEVNAAYRKAAMTAHPDRGGSDEAMRDINAARDAIERERGLA